MGEMASAAITAMKDRTGSSRQAITKYIVGNYKVEALKVTVPLRLALRNGLAKGHLRYGRETGKGSGCYKLVPKEKSIKKPVVKKIAKVKTAKDGTTATRKVGKTTTKPAKKVVAKTSATEKSTTKASAKKSPKKPVAKKVPAKKVAPKVTAVTKKTLKK